MQRARFQKADRVYPRPGPALRTPGGFAALALLASLALVGGLDQRTDSVPSGGVSADAVAATPARIAAAYGTLPLSFEANVGQVDERVDFLARGSGYTLFLTSGEAVLALRQAAPAKDVRFAPPEPSTGAVLRMELSGADPRARATGALDL